MPSPDLPDGFMELSLLLYAGNGDFKGQVCEDPQVLRPGTSPITDVLGFETVRLASDAITRHGMRVSAQFRLLAGAGALRYALAITAQVGDSEISHVKVGAFEGFCKDHLTVRTPQMAPELSRVIIACVFHHTPVLPPFLQAQLDA